MLNEDTSHYPGFLSKEEADLLFDTLLKKVEWHKTIKNINGETQVLKRRMAYMYERPVEYRYGSFVLPGSVIIPEIKVVLGLILNAYGLKFNSVLLNCYDNGKDKINWHSDKEDQLGPNPVIGSLNLGATRKFHFLRKFDGIKMHVPLAHGDFFIMGEKCQENWLHAILPEKDVTTPRISLTFRWVYDDKLSEYKAEADAVV